MKVGRLALAGSRRAASGRVDPVHLLDAARGAVLGRQLQPGDRSLATGARSRARRRSDAAVLGAGDGANAQGGRVQVEEGRRAVEEEVVARHVQLHGAEGPNSGGVEVEVDGHVGHLFQQVLGGAGDVADVEERGQGAGGDGRSVGLAGVAGVVLRAAADGDVLDGQVCGWRGEKPVDGGHLGLGNVTQLRCRLHFGNLRLGGNEVEVLGEGVDCRGGILEVVEVNLGLGRGGASSEDGERRDQNS